MYHDDVYCVCLLCNKEVAVASRQKDTYDEYDFDDKSKNFHPIAEHYGSRPFKEAAPMAYHDKMKVQIYKNHWSEGDLVLVIGICDKCIKKKFKSVLNKHKFIGNVKKT